MEPLRVCHLASGDTWAGAENQIAMLLPELALHKDVALSAIVLNPGQLAQTLRVRGVATAVFDERSDALLALVKKLVAYFSRQHIQVLHTHGYKAHLLGVCERAISRRRPFYYHHPRFPRTVYGNGQG